jgi:hypothetical protein
MSWLYGGGKMLVSVGVIISDLIEGFSCWSIVMGVETW